MLLALMFLPETVPAPLSSRGTLMKSKTREKDDLIMIVLLFLFPGAAVLDKIFVGLKELISAQHR